jgi:enoyl-CoA hydratase/carnithine racemase
VSYKEIIYQVENKVLTITLNRPERLNAFTLTMRNELIDAFDRADGDDEVRAIIVTGAGRAFCAGADLGAGAKTFDRSAGPREHDEFPDRDGGGLVTLRIFDLTKPIIAAINGPAVGIGATMTLPMDYRIAADTARMGFVFTRRGVVMEAASSWFLPRVVGINQAMDWVASGRVFPAEEGLKGGLLKSLHPADQLLAEANRIAREIADSTAPVSVAVCRQMMWKMLGADHPMEAHKIDSRGILELGQTRDAHEGVSSFLEKRPAKYTMKPSKEMPNFYPWWQPRQFS